MESYIYTHYAEEDIYTLEGHNSMDSVYDNKNYLASIDIGWKSRVTVEVNVEWGMEISRMEAEDLMR